MDLLSKFFRVSSVEGGLRMGRRVSSVEVGIILLFCLFFPIAGSERCAASNEEGLGRCVPDAGLTSSRSEVGPPDIVCYPEMVSIRCPRCLRPDVVATFFPYRSLSELPLFCPSTVIFSAI